MSATFLKALLESSLSNVPLQVQSDDRLATLAAQGDERAFEVIVGRFRVPLLRYCRRILRDSAAEDCVQQVFFKAWTSLAAGAEVTNVSAWLYLIARNTCLDALRRRREQCEELPESLVGCESLEAAVERRITLQRALTELDALPERQRRVLLGVAVHGRSGPELAAELGVTAPALRQLLHRARSAVRAAATAFVPPFVARTAPLAGGAGDGGATLAAKLGVVLATGALAITAGYGGPPGGGGEEPPRPRAAVGDPAPPKPPAPLKSHTEPVSRQVRAAAPPRRTGPLPEAPHPPRRGTGPRGERPTEAARNGARDLTLPASSAPLRRKRAAARVVAVRGWAQSVPRRLPSDVGKVRARLAAAPPASLADALDRVALGG